MVDQPCGDGGGLVRVVHNFLDRSEVFVLPRRLAPEEEAEVEPLRGAREGEQKAVDVLLLAAVHPMRGVRRVAEQPLLRELLHFVTPAPSAGVVPCDVDGLALPTVFAGHRLRRVPHADELLEVQ